MVLDVILVYFYSSCGFVVEFLASAHGLFWLWAAGSSWMPSRGATERPVGVRVDRLSRTRHMDKDLRLV